MIGVTIWASRNPWAKLAGMYTVALPSATVVGYVGAGQSGAIICFCIGLVLLVLTAWVVKRSIDRQQT